MQHSLLEIRSLAKSYGDIRALEDVDLDLAEGEILGLLGPNGAGKTTLISIVAGLWAPDRGTVRVGGIDVRAAPMAARGLMGIAPQDLGVYLPLTVRNNLRFFGRMVGLRGRELKGRLEEVADALELTGLLDRKAQQLSGGEQRRLHTALALLHRAPLLLLDEPTAGVDVATRNRLLDIVRRLAAEGASVCYTTHYLHEVEALNASVAILDHGRVVAHGDTRELVASSGAAVVEIRVEGAIPLGLASLGDVEREESAVRIRGPDPAVALTRAVAAMGEDSTRIRSVEFVQPSLESVYLSITGRRFNSRATETVR
jgi:ABC-2 type transport system ATP-binding protein